MGFFKDFKEDLSQAVNELLPDHDTADEDKESEEQMVNTLDSEGTSEDGATDTEMMKEWLEDESAVSAIIENEPELVLLDEVEIIQESSEDNQVPDNQIEDKQEEGYFGYDDLAADNLEDVISQNENLKNDFKEEEGEDMEDNVDLELLDVLNAEAEEEKTEEIAASKLKTASVANEDEVTVISKGTTINGSISSDGSLDIMGTVNGDIECLGKLSITGKVVGGTSASEVYVNTERMEGSIASEGSVKIGLGTVVVGDIVGTSSVIAGAVKGEIDINGPIVIDSTAIIKGNIKAKSVQINNGAVIEGFCSLSYSAVDVDNIFE